MTDQIWYIYHENKQLGPFEVGQIVQLWTNHMISQDAYVFKTGWKDWRPIEECGAELGLSGLNATPPAPPPAPPGSQSQQTAEASDPAAVEPGSDAVQPAEAQQPAPEPVAAQPAAEPAASEPAPSVAKQPAASEPAPEPAPSVAKQPAASEPAPEPAPSVAKQPAASEPAPEPAPSVAKQPAASEPAPEPAPSVAKQPAASEPAEPVPVRSVPAQAVSEQADAEEEAVVESQIETVTVSDAPTASERHDRAPRATVSGRVIIHNKANLSMGVGVNISASGIFIETTDKMFQVGEVLNVTVKVSGLSKQFNAKAEVMRYSNNPSYPIGYGLRFDGLSPSSIADIQGLVDALNDKKPQKAVN